MHALRVQALTLVEMMVTMSVFSLVVVGFIYAQLFGLQQDELVNSKLGASDQSRRGFDRLTTEVRSAKIWQVGNGSQTSFTSIPNGVNQQGTALQISLTTDTNSFIRYYFDTNNCQLCRVLSGDQATW